MQYKTHKDKKKGIEKRTITLPDGNTYLCDSEEEAKYYNEVLKPLYDKGEITKIEVQTPYRLIEPFKKLGKAYQKGEYIPDYRVTYPNGDVQLYDVKGTYGKNVMDPMANYKRKHFDSMYAIPLIWVVYSKKYGGWISFDQYHKLVSKDKKIKKAEGKVNGL